MIKKIFLIDKSEEDKFLKLVREKRNEEDSVSEDVAKIIREVELNKDKAVFEYAKKFDGADLNETNIKVTKEEIEEAYGKIDKSLLEIIKKAKENIESFHSKQCENSWYSSEKSGVILGQLKRALEIVGVYVPGGTAVYPSSVLMNIIPAKVAGVEKIIMATPPRKNGIDPAVLVAANEAGADEIYKMGGAYAIAALAFGTETIPKVDKIVGPGNVYVAAAKKMVFGICDIDSIAGPSEILIIADKTADADFIAADLLSQAEHDKMASSILVTDSAKLADEVVSKVESQIVKLSRKDITRKSIDDFGYIALVNNIGQAVEVSNNFAPEHLEICVEDPFTLLNGIKNAGAIFLGQYSPEPVGDYFAGPNHVIPTGGTARFFSPLSVNDFVKESSVISYTREALENIKDDVSAFATSEGLTAHSKAIEIRFEKKENSNE